MFLRYFESRAGAILARSCHDSKGNLLALPLCRPREEGEKRNRFFVGTHVQCTDGHHHLYRTIGLAKRALAQVLQSLKPTELEVTLLRHHPQPPIPKSLCLSANLPTCIVWKSSEWFTHPETVYAIAPHSISALRASGFATSTLRVQKFPEEEEPGTIIMETTLTSWNENHEHTPRTIELSILLTRFQHGGTYLDPSSATAYFSIKGVRSIGSHCPWPTPSIYTTASPDDPRRYAVQVLKEVPNQTYCDAHTFQYDSKGKPASHTIAHTEHIVNIDGQWNLRPQSAICMARTIRVALQFPFASTVGPYITDLWMSIDMSDSFECTLPYKSVSDRSSPQRIDGVGSEDISYNSCEDEDENFTPSLTAKGATMTAVSSERPHSSSSAATTTSPDSDQVRHSGTSTHSRLSEKRRRQASLDLDAKSLGSDRSQRARLSSPQEYSDWLLSTPPVLSHGRLDPSPSHSGVAQMGNIDGHGTYSDDQSATEDRAWSRSAGEELAIISRPEAETIPPNRQINEQSAANHAGATLPGFPGLVKWLHDIRRSDSPEDLGTQQSPSRHLPSAPTTPLTHSLSENANIPDASQETIETLRRENVALNARIADLETNNANLALRMSEISNRLDTLTHHKVRTDITRVFYHGWLTRPAAALAPGAVDGREERQMDSFMGLTATILQVDARTPPSERR
ncbi:uncharacterized protein TRAVEDRAFT_24700 [Trametes versicolor FP-101664 SS1]|uniref:Uncharacterized protein n=1 Tax=Trametes versicolor (strain FP-101664) TaxID=717944 RepID=R7S8E5_TRAVS|nr:uncharacterized protein TRAVEDRAFT_24700 [Trametes versicolor FP-101664 SS1]EIW51965.1 hypothetical protein TRAVEDRAFT_24700 [Trametes versicolor FP-101664 SS1]